MKSDPYVLLAVSAHGYGHLSQVAPVVNTLRKKLPDLKLGIQGNFDPQLLARRIEGEFDLIPEPADVGFAMHGPTEIDWETTFNWFQKFHANWEKYLEQEKALLKSNSVDLVLADVPYLPIAAADALDIPAVAYCSLNWVDILLENKAVAVALDSEIKQMRVCYQMARYFILPEPSMPMNWLSNTKSVPPVAATPRNRRNELLQYLGLSASDKLVMVSLGGIPMTQALRAWPIISGVHWLVDAEVDHRVDLHSSMELGWAFPDLIGSVDLLLTKPGYGTFTEVAQTGVPVLNIAREDWAESKFLIAWLEQFVMIETVPLDQVQRGEISENIQRLLKHKPKPGKFERGEGFTAQLLSDLLMGNS